MAFTNYYKVLEVERSATVDEIRTAYRKLAKQYHEDFSKSEEDKTASHNIMVDLNEAWRVLNDPEKREKYNQEYDKHFPPPGRSYQQQYTPPNPPPFTPPPPPPRTPPGGAYQQHYAPPNPPPQTPPRWGYGQSYAPPMAPAAEAKQKRNKRIVFGGMGGGAIGGALAMGIDVAKLSAGNIVISSDWVITEGINNTILGAVIGVTLGGIALAVLRIFLGKDMLRFYGVIEVIILTIVGIIAGAIGVGVSLYFGPALNTAFLVLAVVAVVAGVVAGAVVAGIVRKKS